MIERRGRPKEIVIEPAPRKYTKVYEDEYTTETWTYNLDKHHGPISVDIKYKSGAEKAIKQNAKNAKQEKKTARQMKKINNKK
jgi:deoxyadenosine/deoxycytidine kinase